MTFYKGISRQPNAAVICAIYQANLNPLTFNIPIIKKPVTNLKSKSVGLFIFQKPRVKQKISYFWTYFWITNENLFFESQVRTYFFEPRVRTLFSLTFWEPSRGSNMFKKNFLIETFSTIWLFLGWKIATTSHKKSERN